MYIWGGGKTSPHTLGTFKKDLGAVTVCVAPRHFCVVTVEKELYCWSSGQPGEMYGQLGHGDKASYRTPKQVESLIGYGVVDVMAGEDFTIAVLEDQQPVCVTCTCTLSHFCHMLGPLDDLPASSCRPPRDPKRHAHLENEKATKLMLCSYLAPPKRRTDRADSESGPQAWQESY